MNKDPFRAAMEAAMKPLIDDVLAKAKRDIIAAVERAFGGEPPAQPAKPAPVKRERHVEKKPTRARSKSGRRSPPVVRLRPFSSLTNEESAQIAERLRARTATDSAIAREFNVQQAPVSQMRRALGIPSLLGRGINGRHTGAAKTAATTTPAIVMAAPVEPTPIVPVPAVTEAA